MWVSTSFSLALNFLPHQVLSAFQLSIRPPSSRIKRKFPCSAQGGTSSDLARYSLVAGSKEWAEQSRREAATKPISTIFFANRTRCVISWLPGVKPPSSSLLLRLLSSFPSRREEWESNARPNRTESTSPERLENFRRCSCEFATTDGLGRLQKDLPIRTIFETPARLIETSAYP